MRHLRLALESENPSAQTSMTELQEHVDALANIGEGVEGGSDIISMESFLRNSYDATGTKLEAFHVAMEDFSAGIWAAIAAGVAALIALIYKAIKYFMGQGSSSGGGGAIAKAIEKQEVAQEQNKKDNQVLKEVTLALQHSPVEVATEQNGTAKVHDLQQIIDNNADLLSDFEKLLEHHVEFLYGPVRDNAFVKAIGNMSGLEHELLKAVELGTREFNVVSDILLSGVDYGAKDVARYQQTIEKTKQSVVLRKFRIGGVETDAIELARKLQEAYQQAKTKKEGVHNTFSDVNSNLEGYFEHEDIVKVMKGLELNMRKVRNSAAELQDTEDLIKMVDKTSKRYEDREEDQQEVRAYHAVVREGNRVLSKFMADHAGQLRANIAICNLLVQFSNHLSETQKAVHALSEKVYKKIVKTGTDVPAVIQQHSKA